jgi:PPOX class probable F420-dependent enzyme
MMKILQSAPELPGMNQAEINEFLTRKLNMRLATIDDSGDPNIHPMWFYYDASSQKLHALTGKLSRKFRNIRKNPNVYFCIDDENFPPKGVKGKGVAAISESAQANKPVFERIYAKYLGTLEHPMAKMRREQVERGDSIVLDIEPKFFSAWDLGKAR